MFQASHTLRPAQKFKKARTRASWLKDLTLQIIRSGTSKVWKTHKGVWGAGARLALTPFPRRRPLPGPGPCAALPLSRGIRWAALRARPGRLRRPRLRQRRHVRGGRRLAPLLVRAGLRRARLSGTRRPLRLPPLRARRPLLRPLLWPGLRLRAGLHGLEMRIRCAPRRRGCSGCGPAGPETG